MEEISHQDYFCIAGCLKDNAFLLQLAAEAFHVVNLTVVGDDCTLVSELSCHGLLPARKVQNGQACVGKPAVP